MAWALMWSRFGLCANAHRSRLPIVLGRSIEHALPEGRATAQRMAILAVGMWRRSIPGAGTSSAITACLLFKNTQRGSSDKPAMGLTTIRAKTKSASPVAAGLYRSRHAPAVAPPAY